MFDALKQVLVNLQIKVASTAPAESASSRVVAAAQKADKAWGMLRNTIGAALAVQGIRSQINAVVDGADKTRKYAEALGVSVEALQRLSYAADLSGLSQERAQQGLAFFARAQAKAGRGSEDLHALLLEEAEAFRAMPDGPEKTARAMDLFGRGAAEWIPLLNQGADSIRAMGAEADALGIVMSEDSARSAEAYNDEMLRVKSVFRGVRNTLVLQLIPALTRGGEALTRWAREGDRVRRFAALLTKGLGALAAVFAAKKVIAGAQLLAGAIRAIGNAGALASAKLALFVGGIALLALLLEDLYVFAQGGDSLIGRFLGDAEAGPLRAALLEAGQAFADLWAQYKPAVVEGIRVALSWLAKHAPDIARIVAGAVVATIEVFKFLGAVVEVVGTAIGEAAAWLVIAWGEAVDWLAVAIGDVVTWLEGLAEGWESMGAAGKIALGALLLFASPLLGLVAIVWGAVEAFGALWTWAKGAVDSVGQFLSELGEGIGGWLGDTITRLLAELKAVVRALPDVAVPDALREWAAVSNAEALQGEGIGGAAARAVVRAQPAPAVTQSVGTVAVTVQGSTSMGPEDVARAVDDGVKRGMNNLLEEALADMGFEE